MRSETKTKASPKAKKKVKKKEEVKTEVKAGAKKPLGCKFFCITVIVVVATHVFEDNFTSDQNFWWLRKSTFRHRATSTAFHSARKRAEKLGHTPETCKAMGRSAAAEIRNQIDAGLLEED